MAFLLTYYLLVTLEFLFLWEAQKEFIFKVLQIKSNPIMTLVKGPFATNIGVQNSKMLLYQQSCIYLLLQESTSILKQKGSLSHYSKSNHNNYFMIGLLSLGHIFLNQVVSITQERGGGDSITMKIICAQL